MDKSSLLKLPPELRLMVYEIALTHDGPIEMQYSPDGRRRRRVVGTSSQPHLLGLTKTCSQIRTECGNLLFRQNSVLIKVPDYLLSGVAMEARDLLWCDFKPLRTLRAAELTLKVDVTPGHWQKACDRCFAVQINLRAASASLEEAKGVLAQEIEDRMWEVRTLLPHTSRSVAVGDKILHLLKIWKSLTEVWRSLAEEVEHEA